MLPHRSSSSSCSRKELLSVHDVASQVCVAVHHVPDDKGTGLQLYTFSK